MNQDQNVHKILAPQGISYLMKRSSIIRTDMSMAFEEPDSDDDPFDDGQSVSKASVKSQKSQNSEEEKMKDMCFPDQL